MSRQSDKRKMRWSLSLKIIAINLSLIFIAIAIISFLYVNQGKTIILDNVSKSQKAMVMSRGKQIRDYFAHNFERSALVASRTKLRMAVRDIQNNIKPEQSKKIINKILADAKNSTPAILDLTIVSKNGKLIAATNNDSPKDWRDSDLFRNGKSAFYQRPLEISKKNSIKFLLRIALPLYGKMKTKQDSLGVLVLTMDETRIEDLLQTHRDFVYTQEIFLLRKESNKFRVINQDHGMSAQKRKWIQDIARKKNSNHDNTSRIVKDLIVTDYRSKEVYVTSYFNIVQGYALLVKINTDEFYSELRHLNKKVFFTAAMVLLVSLFFALVFSMLLIKPLKSLKSAMEKIMAGDMDQQVRVQTHDEVGELASVFNKMVLRRKEDEKKLRQAMYSAEKANRAKSEFLANISHEVRNPLNGILGFTQLLNEHDLPEKSRRCVTLIDRSGSRLLALLNEILDFSKMESGRLDITLKTFPVQPIIEESVHAVGIKAAQKKLHLMYFVEPDVPLIIFSDQDRLNQILINILSNAVKFTDEGNVELYVQLNHDKKRPGNILFSIADDGKGIGKDKLESIFQPFVQEDVSIEKKFGGTGLGLAISKNLVELLGGEIWAENKKKQGMIFYFTIDAGNIENQVLDESQKEQASILDQQSVLLLEKNEQQKNFLQRKMESWGLQVCSFIVTETMAEHANKMADMIEYFNSFHFYIIDYLFIKRWLGRRKDKSESHDWFEMIVKTGKPIIILYRFNDPVDDYFISIYKPIRYSQLQETLLFAAARNTEQIAIRDYKKKLPAQLQVLVVDDNEIGREVMQHYVENLGIVPDMAQSGYEAVSKAKNKHYDLIFLDIQMPEMDGLETMKRIRQIGKMRQDDRHVLIVAMTGYAVRGDKEEFLAAGMDGYLSKPIVYRELWTLLEDFGFLK